MLRALNHRSPSSPRPPLSPGGGVVHSLRTGTAPSDPLPSIHLPETRAAKRPPCSASPLGLSPRQPTLSPRQRNPRDQADETSPYGTKPTRPTNNSRDKPGCLPSLSSNPLSGIYPVGLFDKDN